MNEHDLSPEEIAHLRAGRAIAALLGPGWLTPEESEPLLQDRQALREIRDLVDGAIQRRPDESLVSGVQRLVAELARVRAARAWPFPPLVGSAYDRHWQRLAHLLGDAEAQAERARMTADEQADRQKKKLERFRKEIINYRRWMLEAQRLGDDEQAQRWRRMLEHRERKLAEADQAAEPQNRS